ncbi:MAG: hypothetical protein O3B95_09955 [Chloroflexi bacterium]|nr:hypothetical protein [Chloroflexota bacterium]
MSELTVAQIDKLLSFRGYGNPNGKFWFVGMEEGGSSDFEHLRIRAEKFEPVEDLAESHKNFVGHDMARLSTSTWRLMSSIVGRIQGVQNWWDTEFARSYQSRCLGRRDGETYLTEILPLPKKRINDWPYRKLFDSPVDYRNSVLPDRRKVLRFEYQSATPKHKFVFCYGKSFWDEHRAVFDFVEFRPGVDGQVEWASNADSVIILTKFFDYGPTGFTQQFVNRVCELALLNSND